MADIELVIKIPEGLKNDFESEQWTALSCMEMKNALEKATPLPKGHGRLIDADKLDTRLNFVFNHTGGYKDTPIGTGIVIAMAENLDAKTIIEADKEQ